MNKEDLKDKLIESLSEMYLMEIFDQLTEFLEGEIMFLYFLSQNINKDLNPSTISSELHMSRPRVAAMIRSLRKKGFIDTEYSREDRRRINVILTDEGYSYIDKKRKNVEGYFDIFIEEMGKDDIIELIRLVDLTIDMMSSLDKEYNDGQGREDI